VAWEVGINYSISVTSLYKLFKIAYENSSSGDPEDGGRGWIKQCNIIVCHTYHSNHCSKNKILNHKTISKSLDLEYYALFINVTVYIKPVLNLVCASKSEMFIKKNLEIYI